MTSTQEKNQGANLIVPRIRPSSAAGGSGRFRPFDHVTGERTILAAALILFFVVGYVVVGLSGSRTGAYTLMTWLDTRIPFIASSVWIYLWTFPAAIIPLFIIRCPFLFRRMVVAYAFAVAISLLFFYLFPVTTTPLRVPLSTLSSSHPSEWVVSTIYSIDPPFNAFPSLHVSFAALSWFSIWKANKTFALATIIPTFLVFVSVCTTKQHYVLDAFGGALLAAIIINFALSPYKPSPLFNPASSYHGVAVSLGVVAVFYVGLYVISHIQSVD